MKLKTLKQVEIIFYPTPTTTNSNLIKIWHLRNANHITQITDKIDIPEFINFIFAYVKECCARKELNPLLGTYAQETMKQKMLMKQTLDNMIPNAEKTLEPDLSFYEDFDRNNII